MGRLGIVSSIALILATSPLVSQTQPPKNPKVSVIGPAKWEPAPQELFAPYWTLEPGWNTELEMRNNLAQRDLTITPVLRTSDGTEVPLAPVTVKPEEVVSLNLQQAVASMAPQLVSQNGAFGSVVFQFDGMAPANAFAASIIRLAGRPIEFHFDAIDTDASDQPSSIEGIWSLPTGSSTGYLFLGNWSAKPIQTSMSVSNVSGKSNLLPMTIGPRQMERLDLRGIMSSLGGTQGGVSIAMPKDNSALSVTEVVFDEVTGFAALMKTFERASGEAVQTHVLRAPMMALSDPDPSFALPQGTVLVPQVFLRNSTGQQLPVSVEVDWRGEQGSGKFVLPALVLSAGQVQVVNLADFQKANQIPAGANWATVVLSYQGHSADLVPVAVTADAGGGHVMQTPFAEGTARLWKGSMWHVDGTHNTLITTGNGGSEPTTAQVTLFYNRGQGKYRIEKALSAGQQLWLDIGQLIRNQVPDSDGNVLPSDTMTGSYELRDLDHQMVGSLYEGKLVIDKTFGHASYGCAGCCGYKNVSLVPSPFAGPPNIDNQDIVQAYDACGGFTDDMTNGAYGWSSSVPAVATLPTRTLHTVGVGTATGATHIQLQSYVRPSCPSNLNNPQQGVTVQVPTSLSIVAGTNHSGTEVSCDAGTGCGLSDSNARSFTYQVNDQNGAPMRAGGLAVWDEIHTTSPNNLNLTSYTTTCPTPNTGPCGKFTDANGQFQELSLSDCAPACKSQNACISGGPTNANQTWHIGSYSIVQSIGYYCQKITVNNN